MGGWFSDKQILVPGEAARGLPKAQAATAATLAQQQKDLHRLEAQMERLSRQRQRSRGGGFPWGLVLLAGGAGAYALDRGNPTFKAQVQALLKRVNPGIEGTRPSTALRRWRSACWCRWPPRASPMWSNSKLSETMTITVRLQEDGVTGVTEHSDDLRWREDEPAPLRQQGGQAELHFRGGRTLVSAPHFSSGEDGGRRATFEIQGGLEDEESPALVTPFISTRTTPRRERALHLSQPSPALRGRGRGPLFPGHRRAPAFVRPHLRRAAGRGPCSPVPGSPGGCRRWTASPSPPGRPSTDRPSCRRVEAGQTPACGGPGSP